MQLKLKAREMTDAQVRYISLVERGANRIPFRVIKREKESSMLNLGNLRQAMKGEAARNTGPVIAALAIPSQLGEKAVAEVTKALKGLDFKVENAVKMEDGTLVMNQTDVDLKSFSTADYTTVRLSENLVTIIKGFRPHDSDAVDGPFMDAMKTAGFYSDLYTATDLLRQKTSRILVDAESPSAAADGVQEVMKQFEDYTLGLIRNLPTVAFKAEQAVATALKGMAGSNCDGDPEMDKNGKPMPKGKKKDDGEADPKAEGGADSKAAAGKDGDADPAKTPSVEEIAKSVTEGLIAQVKGLLDPLSKALEEVQKAQAEMKKDVDSAVQKSEAAAKQVGSTLTATPNGEKGGDTQQPQGRQKVDDEFGVGEGSFDTAFTRKSDKSRRF